MSDTTTDKQSSNCSINMTPQSTNRVLSKMKMPKIPTIAIDALNIINSASYSYPHHTATR